MTVVAAPAPGPRDRQMRNSLGIVAALGAVALGSAVLLAGVVGAVDGSHPGNASTPASAGAAATGSDLDREIARMQTRLRAVPGDYQAWATLGFDYVQQAKLTVDPAYYPKAQAALHRSLSLDHSDNYVAMAGQAALAAARHDFRAALHWARRGLRIDPRSAVLHGALADALTQLGRYAAAEQAAIRMERLGPGTPAEARLSYAAELRGDHRTAVAFMRRALADAAGPADVAFTRYYLGQLALDNGAPATALRHFAAGLAVAATDTSLLEGRAKAERALGRTAVAVRDFRTVVTRVPQPAYVLEYGELLQSLGRRVAADRQWRLFRTEEQLFRANGVTLDADQTLYEADHGDPAAAVRIGARAVRTRPFVETYDAYAWALHRAGADRRALVASNIALRPGVRNALFLFHRGEIERALGRTNAARRDLEAALRLNPAFSPLWARVARHHLATMRPTS